MAKDGHGTTVTWSGFTANLISVDGPSRERGAIDTTVMSAQTAMTYIAAALYDGGSMDLTVEYNGDETIPIGGAATEITIAWAGQSTGYKTQFTGFMTAFSPSAAIGERITGKVSCKVAGIISTT